MMNGTVKKIKMRILTFQEWQDALKVPLPEKNKKKYNRNNKHKNKSYE
jgi:hypothetical protein